MPLTKSVDELTDVVVDLKREINRKTFTTRVVVGGTIVIALLALAVGGIGINDIHDSNRARCLAGNEFRKADKARWEYIIQLSPPPTTQEALDRLQKFQGYIATADALKHC